VVLFSEEVVQGGNRNPEYGGGRSNYGGASVYGGATVYEGGKTPMAGGNATPSYYPQSTWGGQNDFDKED